MATGVVKTFEDYHEKNLSSYAGMSVYDNVRLYSSLKMTQTYDAGTGKSKLTFSDFKMKYNTDKGYNLGNLTSVVFGSINVTVNGTAFEIFTGSNKAYSVAISKDTYGTVYNNSNSSQWSYVLEVDHNTDGSLSVDVEWSGITLEYNWNGLGFAIAGSETVALTANAESCALTINAGTGSTITVNRTYSVSGLTGTIDGSEVLYVGDVLEITFAAEIGYDLETHTVNGSPFTSGGTHTVSAAVTIASTATVKSYELSIVVDEHMTVTVNRTSSPLMGAATGEVDGAIFHGDILEITTVIAEGYSAEVQTINGNAFASGDSHTVTGNVTIIVVAESSGTANIGGALYQIGIGKGGSFALYVAYVGNGESYDILS